MKRTSVMFQKSIAPAMTLAIAFMLLTSASFAEIRGVPEGMGIYQIKSSAISEDAIEIALWHSNRAPTPGICAPSIADNEGTTFWLVFDGDDRATGAELARHLGRQVRIRGQSGDFQLLEDARFFETVWISDVKATDGGAEVEIRKTCRGFDVRSPLTRFFLGFDRSEVTTYVNVSESEGHYWRQRIGCDVTLEISMDLQASTAQRIVEEADPRCGLR